LLYGVNAFLFATIQPVSSRRPRSRGIPLSCRAARLSQSNSLFNLTFNGCAAWGGLVLPRPLLGEPGRPEVGLFATVGFAGRRDTDLWPLPITLNPLDEPVRVHGTLGLGSRVRVCATLAPIV